MAIKKIPLFLSNSIFLFIVDINSNNSVITININKLPLNLVVNVKGFITAPNPINKHKFKMLEPDIFPNNRSVSSFFAATIPVIISGKDVPIATIVMPINLSDHPISCAISIKLSTTNSEPNFNPNIPKII